MSTMTQSLTIFRSRTRTSQHGQRINAAIRDAGVVWHACDGCGRDWPFPTGFGLERDWQCHVCTQALWATLQRRAALSVPVSARPLPMLDCVAEGGKVSVPVQRIP